MAARSGGRARIAVILHGVLALALARCGRGPSGAGEPTGAKPAAGPSPSLSPRPSPDPGPALARRSVLYVDVTASSGIDFVHDNGATGHRYLPETMGSGGCALDYDGDGWMDIYLVQSGPVPGADRADAVADRGESATNRLFRNLGNGSFEDRTRGSGSGDPGYGQGAACADYDNDGLTDIYVVNLGPNALLRNNGDGTFSDRTRVSGTGDPLWGSSATWFDADGDGHLDLYVANYLDFTVARHRECGRPSEGLPAYCHPDAYAMAPDVFYRNLGNGTFRNATAAAGLADTTGKGMGVVAADVDNDGDPDLYVANDSTPNFLYRNRGNGTFEEAGAEAGVAYAEDGKTQAGMGVDIGDLDDDGWLDILVTNLSHEGVALYLGGKDGFTWGSHRSGLFGPSFPFTGFGTAFADLENDADLDILVANGHVIDNIEKFEDSMRWKQPVQAYRNQGDGSFVAIDAETAGDISSDRAGRGAIVLDHDNDGRLDLLVQFNDDRARLFRNTGGAAGNWIGFSLEDRSGNRSAIGARVTVEAGGRRHIEELKAGSSYQVSADPRLHFGLGARSEADRVTVRWRDGRSESFEHLAGGRYWRLGAGEPPKALPGPG